ncbi:hypothetical protein Taro_019692 [Colocasia esculenta]|uniref:Uncharacterized protein n=1 Tax=Colocasia esculenta TaxID=4460 RepID=A0A843UXI0_COLES|nr:hypothetical protein [Colocasia esculenta]
MLGHLFSLLPSSSRRSQSTEGFTPFLQIWGYTCFTMGHGTLSEGHQTMVPLLARWEVAPDPRVTDRRVGDMRVALDHYPHEQCGLPKWERRTPRTRRWRRADLCLTGTCSSSA